MTIESFFKARRSLGAEPTVFPWCPIFADISSGRHACVPLRDAFFSVCKFRERVPPPTAARSGNFKEVERGWREAPPGLCQHGFESPGADDGAEDVEHGHVTQLKSAQSFQ